jgi:hypothetical protein
MAPPVGEAVRARTDPGADNPRREYEWPPMLVVGPRARIDANAVDAAAIFRRRWHWSLGLGSLLADTRADI